MHQSTHLQKKGPAPSKLRSYCQEEQVWLFGWQKNRGQQTGWEAPRYSLKQSKRSKDLLFVCFGGGGGEKIKQKCIKARGTSE
jgi:hypothetical protein